MPTILAIDTSTGPCSVAVWHNGKITAYVENTKPVVQSAELIGMIEAALKQSAITYNDLTQIAATTGPGSFTGIRVGLASARGIAFATKRPTVGYTTLEVVAAAARKENPGPVLAVLNAGKGEYYYQPFDASGTPLAEPLLAAPETALALGGTIAGNIPGATCSITFPRAHALAELAALKPAGSQALRPYYIRPPDAKLPTKK